MMIQNLNMKGYNALAFSIPSGKELLTIFGLAAPVFITLMSKVVSSIILDLWLCLEWYNLLI